MLEVGMSSRLDVMTDIMPNACVVEKVGGGGAWLPEPGE